jgi:hypothetical protein
MDIVLVPDLPAGTTIMFDPSHFIWFSYSNQFMKQAQNWMLDPSRKLQYIAKFTLHGQLLSNDPSKAVVWEAVTA